MARLPQQTAARAGTVALVNGYRTANSLDLGQVYRARPKQIAVPSVFIDRISEDADAFTREESQRTVRVSVRIVWGLYDAGEAVDQRDAFVDGFYAHVTDNYHAFGGNAECNWIGVTDDPFWTPEWIEGDEERYMTEITLEGRAST
jgi:hypothetical protein